MKTNFKIITLFFSILLLVNCNRNSNEDPGEVPIGQNPDTNDSVEINCFFDTPDPEKLIEGAPLPIVQGKLLSWATSTDDEIAYTPPGKWVNIYGTVYYRYVEREDDSSVKVSEVAATCSSILNQEQLDRIINILSTQAVGEEEAISNRDLIARELIKYKEGVVTNESLILNLAEENGLLLADLVEERSAAFGEIFQTLTNEQKNEMCEIRKTANHAASSNEVLTSLDKSITTSEREIFRLLLSKFFVWATGSEEVNRVIDAGRPAVFFGFANLRVEDRSGEEVSSGLRGEVSKLVEEVLDENQNEMFDALMLQQENALATYYQERGDLASLIIGYQNNTIVDANRLLDLCVNAEIAEAELAIIQAKGMGEIIQNLSADQLKIFTDFKSGNGD